MQVNPYIFYNGNCEAAFKYYEQALGARIEMMLTWKHAPPEIKPAPGQDDKVMYARLTMDGEVLMAGDAPPGHFHAPQGFAVSLMIEDSAEAERRFKALADGGRVTMPFAPTFFSKGYGMCTDRFGIPWMVNCRAA